MDIFYILLTLFIALTLFIGALIILAIFSAIFRKKSDTQSTCNSAYLEPAHSTSQTEKDSVEDSEGDGLTLFDDPMFPPEFEDEDDEF